MNITLQRPIIFFDLETTGTRISEDRIVSIAVVKFYPNQETEEKHVLINPLIPIPAGATAIHGISDEEVKDQPTFKQRAKSLKEYFTGCDIGGFNCLAFDIPLLSYEFDRCGIEFPDEEIKILDVQRIFHKKEERTLSAALKFYCEKEHEDAHDALADVRATIDVFKKQVEIYTEIGNTLNEFVEYIKDSTAIDIAGKLKRNNDGEIVFTFGKNKDKAVISADQDYLNWILNDDFPIETKRFVRKIISGELV